MTVEAEDCSMLRCTSLCEGDELGYVSGIDDNDIPEEYLCVITQSVMKDPVVLLTEAGCSYERRALERWLDEHPRRDPLTNKDYPHKLKFGPNRSLKVTIDRWRRMSYRRKVAPAANRRAEIEASARQDKLREILDTPRRRRLRRGKQSSRAVSRPLRVESQSAARYRAAPFLFGLLEVPRLLFYRGRGA
ncbi:hypothetical protein CTAYLR_007173 [Chrysophaeum taylorii]|uniref:U-box domain-containing protein n=1 Tax=Chrysophaeum taylorii TaxID=2483200 RepID=A0AAD7UKP1_9STRA|nr:hypothetical protein CTAYLR_007173 [Chrysophaeum taylorii]